MLVYQIDSYWYWQRYFGWDELSHGSFGENFTVDGLPDDEVCIGDRYRIGQAEFEVTQPRVTCYRVGLRLGQPELPALLVGHHRPGFYLLVVSDIRHKSPVENWTGGFRPGTDPQRRDYASFADFADPDGNTWIIQEIGHRPRPGIGGG